MQQAEEEEIKKGQRTAVFTGVISIILGVSKHAAQRLKKSLASKHPPYIIALMVSFLLSSDSCSSFLFRLFTWQSLCCLTLGVVHFSLLRQKLSGCDKQMSSDRLTA